MKLIISIILSVLLIFPQSASAIYYDRAGNPVPFLSGVTQEKKVASYPDGSIKTKWRQWQTDQYDYLVEHKCQVQAVNLYRGETLYLCDNDLRFWSDVLSEPALAALYTKNRKKSSDEDNDAISASAPIPAITTSW